MESTNLFICSEPYCQRKGKGPVLFVYLEPKIFLHRHPFAFDRPAPWEQGTLALLKPNATLVHQAIATQRQVRRVHIISDPLQIESPETRQFYEYLKRTLDPFSIETSIALEAPLIEPSQHNRNPTVDQSLDLGRN